MSSVGGYTFKNEKNKEQALTHASYGYKNYERLEYLGDSILDFLIADILFQKKSLKESELTRARANIVSEDNLCRVFDELNIEKDVKIGKSMPRLTKAIKADMVESIIACIYLESGIKQCKKFILDNFNIKIDQNKDYKTMLQEYAQKYRYSFEYKLTNTTGPAHDYTFFVSLYVDEKIVSSACAKSKVEAEKKCAKIALEHFKQI